MNIVICEDDNCCRSIEVKIVKEYMNEVNEEYKIIEFNDYDSRFRKIINTKCKKIYILDIETPSASGIDIARDIRKNDTESVIIFITGHDEYGKLVLKRNISCLTFINKFDNLKVELRDALKDACHYLKNDMVIKIIDSSVTYNIRLNRVLYITKDSIERRTIVKLDNTEYRLNMPLRNVKDLFGSKFIQTHRSCFVNKSRISIIDHKNKTITFDNGNIIDLLSATYEMPYCI